MPDPTPPAPPGAPRPGAPSSVIVHRPPAGVERAYGAFGHAPFLCTYGPSGVGKDADMIKAWPDAYLVGFEGSADAWSLWGERMAPHPQQDLGALLRSKGAPLSIRTVNATLRAVEQGKLPWRPAILISDLSLLADVDVDEIEDTQGKGWDMWAAVLRRVRDLRNRARTLNMVVAVNGHDVGQKEAPGHPDHVRGGMKLASHKGRAEFHKMTDMNIRVVAARGAVAQAGWANAYEVVPDDSWFTKDRWNKVQGVTPMNLRELLIASPNAIDVSRRKDLAWIDTEADRVVALVRAGASVADAAGTVEQALLDRGEDPGEAYMAAYDGACRSIIRAPRISRFAQVAARREAATSDLFTSSTAAKPAPAPAAAPAAAAATTPPSTSSPSTPDGFDPFGA
jgi:hypothetical protein